jgi:hypothetical protein
MLSFQPIIGQVRIRLLQAGAKNIDHFKPPNLRFITELTAI